MPQKDDLCIWCNRRFGEHRSFGNHCPTNALGRTNTYHPTKSFMLQGSMKMSNFPIGTDLFYYTSGDGKVVEKFDPSMLVGCGRCVLRALANPLFPATHSVLLGWTKTAAVLPGDTWIAYYAPPEYVKLLSPTFDYGLWVDAGTPVRNVASIPGQSSITDTQQTPLQDKPKGMHCSGKFCGAFNDYAEPNQPDGTFKCYTCRSKYH